MTVDEDHLINTFVSKIKQQEVEDSQILNLNANENQMSRTARAMLSTRLADRYNLGTPNEHQYAEIVTLDDFTFKGLKHIYEVEKLANDTISSLFHSVQCEFRLLSGIHAMLTSIIAFTEVGDTIYSIDYANGGHFATHYVIKKLGRIPYSMYIDPINLSIDLQLLQKQFIKNPPKMIYFDMGCPLLPIPIQEIKRMVGPETILIYDASHTLGLIAGGKFQDPLKEGADILQGNTHKTFPGPQKAIIASKDQEHAKMLSEALNHGLVSNRHNHHDLALFVTIFEMKAYGKSYAEQMLANAACLAKNFIENDIQLLGINPESPQSHILLILGDSVGGYVEACRKLLHANICTNSRYGFGREIIRLGVQELTRRGMKEQEMKIIANFFKKILKDNIPVEKIKNDVIEFNNQFRTLEYSFD